MIKATANVRAAQVLAVQNTQVVAPANTNENTLFSFTVPANSMGANGVLKVSYITSCTNSANSKSVRVKLGATTFQTSTVTTVTGVAIMTSIRNRNATNSQMAANSAVGDTSGSVGLNTGSIDTTQDQTFSITGIKASGAETLALESVIVELIPG